MTEITCEDIHKIIDDAMKNRNRCVHIMITGEYTSISVNPIDNVGMRWIMDSKLGHYTCSKCGGHSNCADLYCSECGEQRTGIIKEN